MMLFTTENSDLARIETIDARVERVILSAMHTMFDYLNNSRAKHMPDHRCHSVCHILNSNRFRFDTTNLLLISLLRWHNHILRIFFLIPESSLVLLLSHRFLYLLWCLFNGI